MTRKTTLFEWADNLNCDVDADSTISELEKAISAKLAQPEVLPFRQAMAANIEVLRQELPSTARAVAANLWGAE